MLNFQIFIKMVDLETDHEWVWSKEKFLNRKFIMQELFQQFEDGEDISNISAVCHNTNHTPDAHRHSIYSQFPYNIGAILLKYIIHFMETEGPRWPELSTPWSHSK